jgi:hypothetical protein
LYRALPIAMTAVLVAACAPDLPPAPPRLAVPSDFESTIARLDARDPQSPEALNARLEYADLLSGSGTGDCHNRLDIAQAQLDTLSARPALGVVLPFGRAKLESAKYKIHAARADCDGARREDELKQSLEAARNAVGLYRDALDYQSAAIMQFNAAATEHDLGDQPAANSALQTAIEMDRDYGFRDDAEDNIRLLQRWRGEDESDATIAQLMKDFPVRTAEFKFDWSPSEADVAIDTSDTNLAAGTIIHSHGAIVLKRHVRQDQHSWDVSYDPGMPAIEMGDWPPKNEVLQRFTAYLLATALLRTPKFSVDHTGDFEVVREARDYGDTLSALVAARSGGEVPGDAHAAGSLKALAENLKLAFAPQNVQANTQEQYNLETATWAGAKFQQGVWYQMSAPLFVPGLGLGQFLVNHDIQFSFTRMVACTPGDAEPSCAEIVVHATPAAEDLKNNITLLSRALYHSDANSMHYWATIDLRLVVKPETLVPYVSDWRRYWYIGMDSDSTVVSSERVVAVSTYH